MIFFNSNLGSNLIKSIPDELKNLKQLYDL